MAAPVLDEIGELPLDAQARLRVTAGRRDPARFGGNALCRRAPDCRHHRDLQSLSRSGEFRLDLYYRLNVMQIDLLPLRNDDDIPAIAKILLERACAAMPALACACRGPRAATSSAMHGPATCVSSRMPWSAASSSPKGI